MPCKNHPEIEEGLVRCSRCGEEFCRDCVVELRENVYCAACKGEQVKDIVSGADAALLDLASIGRRFAAIIIDNLLMLAVAQLVTLPMLAVMPSIPSDVRPVVQLVWSMLSLLIRLAAPLVYEGLMLQARGQTLGKMALRIKVVTPEGRDITPGQAWLRAFIRLVLGCTVIVDYIPAFFAADKKCIHDMAATTRVVNWRP